jgi:hypothetical protein
MSEFNFGSFSTTSAVNTSKPQLKPYNSYKVKYAGSRIEHMNGKKDPEKVWDILKIRFEGEDGYYEESVFFLNDNDKERPKYKNAEGHEYERPSRFENTMTLLIQLATVLNPEAAKKFQAALPKCRSFEDVANVFIKVLEKEQNKELYIKLLGRTSNGAVYASLPSCCGLSKDGERFPINVFSQKDDFNWSAYELQKKNEYLNAKPTAMSSSKPSEDLTSSIDTATTDSSEFDIDSLLN